MNVTEPHWWLVNIGTNNSSMPSGNKTVTWTNTDQTFCRLLFMHDCVIKWKLFPRFCTIVRGIHRSPVNSPHKGQWREALMFSLICRWTNSWGNNDDLRRYRARFDVNVMTMRNYRHGVLNEGQLNTFANSLYRIATIKTSIIGTFIRTIHRRPVHSPDKGPVMRKTFQCHDVIMTSQKR